MNFLAHCLLAHRNAPGEDGLLVGGLLGDFIRGRAALEALPEDLRHGVELHRHIDSVTDAAEPVRGFKREFPAEFRRYAGVIMDVSFDHCLARDWSRWSELSLEEFDGLVRDQLDRHAAWVTPRLGRFMAYADIRGLFAAYRDRDELMYTLANMGQRLSRANPLHRVPEIWDDLHPRLCRLFHRWFPELDAEVAAYLDPAGGASRASA